MSNLNVLKFIFPLFVGWIIVLLFLTYLGLSQIPSHGKSRALEFADSQTDYWIKWANWDGGHFRGIAEHGYLHSFQVVFFPFYPMLIKSLTVTGIQSLWGGLLISYVATLTSLFFLYKLVIEDFDKETAKKAVFLLLAFPTSFYLAAVYSESLFLALSLSAIYFARKQDWALASLFAGLSAVTRLAGVGIIIAVFIEYFLRQHPKFELQYLWTKFQNRLILYTVSVSILFEWIKSYLIQKRMWTLSGVFVSISYYLNYLIIFLTLASIFYFLFRYIDWKKIYKLPFFFLISSFLPIILYFLFLNQTQGDYFAFLGHEENWGRALTLPWEAPINYFNNLHRVNFLRVGGASQALMEFVFFVIILFLFLISLLRLRTSYTIFFAIAIILPISTGTLQAIHRYALIAFPMIIALATIKNEYFQKIWLFFSLTFLGILTMMFFNAYWVT